MRGGPAGQRLVRPVDVIDQVERVDLLLLLLERAGQRLLVEVAE